MTDIFYITRAKLSLRRAHVHNILRTADALSREEFRVTVLTSAPLGDEAGIRRANGVGGDFAMRQVGSLIGALWRERSKGGVCYVRDPFLWPVALFARVCGFKVISEIHGNRESATKRFAFPMLVRTSHGVLFITERLRAWYNVSAKPHAVIPCVGVRDDEIREEKSFDYRSHFHLAQEDFLAVYIGGGAGKYYDLSLLVKSLPLCDEHIKLIFVGVKEEELAALRILARSLGVGERVFACDRFNPSETLFYMRGASALVSPKVWAPEGGVSAKYYGYLASGKPIVASDTTTDREVLTDDTALLVTPTPEAFASALGELAGSPEKQKAMGERARVHAYEFSETMRTERIRDVIQKVIA